MKTSAELRDEFWVLQTRRQLAVCTPEWIGLYQQCETKRKELDAAVAAEQRIRNCGRVVQIVDGMAIQ